MTTNLNTIHQISVILMLCTDATCQLIILQKKQTRFFLLMLFFTKQMFVLYSSPC